MSEDGLSPLEETLASYMQVIWLYRQICGYVFGEFIELKRDRH